MLLVLAGAGLLRGLQDATTPLVVAAAAHLLVVALGVWSLLALTLDAVAIAGQALAGRAHRRR